MNRVAIYGALVAALFFLSTAAVVSLPDASASGGTTLFIVASPWTNTTSNWWAPNALGCGSNTNIYGPTTHGGTDAYIYPESKATTATCGGANNNYELVSAAGFGTSSWRPSTAVAVTATFFWNLSWSTTISIPAGGTGGTPAVSTELQIYANVQDLSTGVSAGNVIVNIFDYNLGGVGGWNQAYTNTQSSPTPEAGSIAFTTVAGNVYSFSSNITADVNSYCLACTAGTTLTLVSFLNMSPGYDGAMSAVIVYT